MPDDPAECSLVHRDYTRRGSTEAASGSESQRSLPLSLPVVRSWCDLVRLAMLVLSHAEGTMWAGVVSRNTELDKRANGCGGRSSRGES